MVADVRQDAESVQIQHVEKKRIMTLRFHSYYPKTVDVDKWDAVTRLSDAALITYDRRAYVILYTEEVL